MKALHLLAILILVAACSPNKDRDRSAHRSADAGFEQDVSIQPDTHHDDVEPIDPDVEIGDLGRPCPVSFVCNMPTCMADDIDECEGELCVWQAELSAAYCSRPCLTTCAPGYTCQDLDDDSGRACVSNFPECGNGTIEYGEVCDGQQDCLEDCSAFYEPPAEMPLSGGTLSTSLHGTDPEVVTGDEPTVIAHVIAGRLFIQSSANAIRYAMDLPAADFQSPANRLLEVELFENFNATCTYVAATMATITAFDFDARTIAGHASMSLECPSWGSCNGCAPPFPVAIEFDLRWVDKDE